MKRHLLLCFFTVFYLSVSIAQKSGNEAKESKDSISSQFKPFNKIITSEAQSDSGLFNVHFVKENLYYEIPDSLLNQDMLLVSRIAQAPSNFGPFLSGGSKVNEQLIRWERKRNTILLRTISYNAVANDSLPIYKAVRNNNYAPIIASFKIETINNDSNAVVIKVNDLFTKDVKAIGPVSKFLKERYKISGLDSKRTYIESAKSFPLNLEVKHSLTFNASNPPANQRTGSISLLMNQSMIFLPKKVMTPRHYDARVGWFTISQIDFGSEELKADQKRYIRRWRLEPKDPEAYARGELVEPVKPIVYYLDPATPERWRPYFKMGVEDWQKAFESAGFKNAIIAKDPPTAEEDPEFSPEDVRYSVIRYIANMTRNAMGPSVADPRSGEIIESDILWYHNHLRSYRNRYLIETAAANPRARTLDLPEEDIGEMVRAVIAHEVGHTLGLPHNMRSSSAYPVDSLRSGSFTHRMGLSPSIMDYARVNYIAQEEDKGIRFIRKLGPYDSYAINWGYRWLGNNLSSGEEKPILNKWIIDKADDPVYHFGGGSRVNPNAQTEDLGNNPVTASEYGLLNLKKVVPNLVKWTSRNGKDYSDLKEIYTETVQQWNRYIGHVITSIGGVYSNIKTAEQEGLLFESVPNKQQRAAMQFLTDHVFTTPQWLLNKDILRRLEGSGAIERVQNIQARALNRLLEPGRLQRLVETEAFETNETYKILDMFSDMRSGIWDAAYKSGSPDPYQRNLQRIYIQKLASFIKKENIGPQQVNSTRPVISTQLTDLPAIARAELSSLQQVIKLKLKQKNLEKMTTYHLKDCQSRIAEILEG